MADDLVQLRNRMGDKITKRRTQLGWSTPYVAHRAGVSLETLHAIELGQPNAANLERLLAIAQTLDVTLYWLTRKLVPNPSTPLAMAGLLRTHQWVAATDTFDSPSWPQPDVVYARPADPSRSKWDVYRPIDQITPAEIAPKALGFSSQSEDSGLYSIRMLGD